jgi:hypothetical protein
VVGVLAAQRTSQQRALAGQAGFLAAAAVAAARLLLVELLALAELAVPAS